MKRFFITMTLASAIISQAPDASATRPEGSYKFAERDTCSLFLDYYRAKGEPKATVIFVFGGGFKEGSRDNAHYGPWFEMLTSDGYNVASIDYRLGLKDASGAGVNPKFIRQLDNAIHIAVEDLCSATRFIIDNASELGADPSKIIISGSSAGAMTSLQTEWELCNSGRSCGELPEGFNFAGVVAFSGAIFSKEGNIRFARTPCPILMFHGTRDGIVNYKRTKFFRLCFAGSSAISAAMTKAGIPHSIYRYEGNGHEIAAAMVQLYPLTLQFLDGIAGAGPLTFTDACVVDGNIPVPDWAKTDYKGLYK